MGEGGRGGEGRRASLLAYLGRQAARAAQLSEIPAPDQPLSGLDSLAALELSHAVEADLGLALPLTFLLAGPTLASLAERVSEELQGGAQESEPLLAADPRPTEFPLSHGQRALWYLDRLAPDAGAYNLAAAAQVTGDIGDLNDLDAAALVRAFTALAGRHPVFRTTFAASDGEPRQRIGPEAEVDFAAIDLSGASDSDLDEHLHAEAFRPFDLENGPLLRLRLLLRGAERVLLFAVHHLVTDLGSLGLVWRELSALYQGADAAALPPLPGLAYSDYVDWQRRRLAGGDGEKLFAHWREQLSGAELPDLALPTDRPRPPVQTHRGGSEPLHLGAESADPLRELAGRSGGTLFGVLLAGFQALLNRYTGQEDLAVGSPVSGRIRAALADLPGYLVNTVVLRGDLGGDPSFAFHLDRTARTAGAALAHQDYPFALLAEKLRPGRDPSRSPLFQAFFALQRSPDPASEALAALALGAPAPAADLGGLALTPLPLARRPAQFDLALEAAELSGGLAAVLRYNADLFDAVTARRMLEHFERLLAGAVARPEAPLSALPILGEAERRQLLADWNATAQPLAAGVCLHHLFEEQARRTPDAPAVEIAGSAPLLYRELAERANRLAHYLRRLGVGPEVLVGIHLERSPLQVVALLGILEAGGAYLPLDPTYPEERLAFMLADSGVGTVLTESRLTLPGGFRGTALRLDADWEQVADESGEDPAVAVDPGNLAYVIYTSGSTGRPKGVLLSHRGVVNFLAAMRRQPGLDAADVLLSVTTLSFDIAALEIFLPLSVGARLVLARRETAADGAALAAEIARSGATALQATPATWRLLLEGGWQGDGRLKVLCGGEALPRALADALLARGGELWNLYGPTETTIWSAAGRVEPGDSGTAGVLLGAPIDNTRIHVLDRHAQPVPVGVPGELVIGGLGLARGYFRRPGLTAERFIPDTFSDAGERLYRTGDLARYRPSGASGGIEFLGRVDHQIKVRGHRVELGEIEAGLAAHPAVRQAVVLAREDRPGAPGALGDVRLVAYLVPEGPPPSSAELRSWLRARLPEPMVPGSFVALAAWPLTPNGKIDRRALPPPEAIAAEPRPDGRPPRLGLEGTIATVWREVLGREQVGVEDNFFDLGGHSLLLARVHARLRAELPQAAGLTMVDLLRHPTVAALAARLSDASPAVEARPQRAPAQRSLGGTEIAIVGMSGRFPGAPDVARLWQNLRQGAESIVPLTDAELAAAGVDPALLADPAYVKAAAALDGVDLFDAPFFGFTPREAETLDPQHRLFLECAWEALETAGYDPGRVPGAVGVYAGVGLPGYLLNHLQANRAFLDTVGGYQAFIGNDKDFVPTRVSYKLGLTGPSVNVQTACSSSLVAVHLARQALLLGECDMALAGGVSIAVPHKTGYLYQEGGIASPDGHCRPFDARSRGTVRGSGVGIVVLKRLADALADGDRVHAVIRGSAINNDGAEKVGYTAPSAAGQAEAIVAALASGGVGPETVGYVEAHGTGTELGDPVEVAALSDAFRRAGGSGALGRGFCALGSLKSNLGHLDTAAGVAGLIKAALAVESGELPPSLHFESPNPNIDFASSPFAVNTALRPWPRQDGEPRRAGVSSFGIGGTNAHVVLEEAPAAAPSGPSRPVQLLLLSARTEAALDAATANLAADLAEHPDLGPTGLADVAYTLQVGRKAFPHRRTLVCRDAVEATQALAARDPERLRRAVHESGERPVAFLFPGQGAQHAGMAAGLYAGEPLFRELVDEGAEHLRPELGLDLRELLFPAAGTEDAEEAGRRLNRTALAQPALFVVEHALARLLLHWGIRPQAMLGHSLGEIVAATIAGVLSYADGLAMVAARGRLMEELPGGAMVAVPLPPEEAAAYLDGDLSLAAINGPRAVSVSGSEEACEGLLGRLEKAGVEGRLLHVSHAFHSLAMDSAVAPFAERVKSLRLSPPEIPFLSNVTGTWITPKQATDPAYWGRHLRAPVRFADGLTELLGDSSRLLLEVGPGHTLATLARTFPGRPAAISSLRHPRDPRPDLDTLLDALGQLWLGGAAIDWRGFWAGERRRRAQLPTYPFERRRHWVEPARGEATVARKRPAGIDGWFYAPFWKQTPPPSPRAGEDGPWLVFCDPSGVGEKLAERLRAGGSEVVEVTAGQIDPRSGAAYDGLLASLGRIPRRIVHCWAVTGAEAEPGLVFDSLLLLAQALGRRGANDLRLDVVSDGLHRLAGDRVSHPEKALLLGPCKVIPQEYPRVRCRSIDLPLAEGPEEADAALDGLLAELAAESQETVVAWRGGERWVQAFEPVQLGASVSRLRERGVYLVTGGLGGLGLTFARHLAETVKARLVLVSRTARPDAADPRLLELERLGAEVMVAAADVADPAAIAAVVAAARERFGAIHGVVHAAGVPGGGLIQIKRPEAAAEVLAPKLQGTLVLERVLGDERLDFFLLCSSINAVLGGFGQVDYCAANAFQDAFARSRSGRRGTFHVAVGWDRWREVGMAASAPEGSGRGVPPPWAGEGWDRGEVRRGAVHPLLDRCLASSPERSIYSSELSVSGRWVLAEHRILGRATVPGTTYLEMARAAYEQSAGDGSVQPVEIREALFLTPLSLGDGEQVDVLTLVERDGEGHVFRIQSALGETWREHARGRIGRTAEPATPGQMPRQDLAAIRERCSGDLSERMAERARGLAGFLATGPRWQCLQGMQAGAGETLAELELDESFAGELGALALHPALLDVAAGSIQLRAQGNYLPLAYESLRLHAPLPRRLWSHAVERGGALGDDVLTCDLSLLDSEGTLVAEVRGFSMKRLGEEILRQLAAESAVPIPAHPARQDPRLAALLAGRYGEVEGGIATADGSAAFARILAGPALSQIVVSTRDLPAAIAEAKAFDGERLAAELASLAPPAGGGTRPALASEFLAPGSDQERRIAGVWRRVLGIDEIGVHDNFFELGGTSLSGVQLIAELKKELGIDVPAVSIFEAPTVAALVRLLAPKEAGPAFDHAAERAKKKQEALERQRTALQGRRRAAR
jgi:amino acid adenylation domain-containing protein